MDQRSEILKVFAHDDVLELPLTAEEVFLEVQSSKFSASAKSQASADPPKFLFPYKNGGGKVQSSECVSLLDILSILEKMVEEGVLEKEEVFYCFAGRKEIIKQRKTRYPISLQKMLKAGKWMRLFSFLPFIQKIFVAGTVSDQNAKDDSDTDLVVEAKKGRLWTARFFLNALLSVLNMRPSPGRTRNTFCTSFFYDETFDPKTIMPEDPVFQHWIGGRIHDSRIAIHDSRIKKILEYMVSLVPEGLYRWIQIHILMPKDLRAANMRGGELDVYFDSQVAKFHLNNRRKEFNQQLRKKFEELGLARQR